ncbi:hypothetical protein GCM10010302_08430 [Streptomyces polychromogenes]|uniref:Uncharacterized protein n=1 Tax=Streptomyces polychromogenes TaxID=67342 RepID=A0ABP3EPR5_9ACTN
MPDAQDGLEQAGDAGGAFEMPDIGLHGPHQQGVRGAVPVGLPAGEDGAEGGCLDRVADRGAGAVEFHVLHLVPGDAGAPQRGPDHPFLRLRAGDGEPGGGAVVVDRAAAQHGVDVVPVGEGRAQRLEHQCHGALAAYVAVGAGVEDVAAAVRGQTAEPLRSQRSLREEVEVHARGDGDRGLARPHALGGQVDRDQRRRLGRVHHDARPAQVQGVGDPVGDDRPVHTGVGVRGDVFVAAAQHEAGVVVAERSHEDRGGRAGQGGRDDPGVLQRRPGQFEHQALLRVHRRRFPCGNAEEGGVEVPDPVEEGAVSRTAVESDRIRNAVPPVVGDLGYRIAAVTQEVPEFRRPGCPGETAGNSDDRHRFVVTVLVPVVPCRHLKSLFLRHPGQSQCEGYRDS